MYARARWLLVLRCVAAALVLESALSFHQRVFVVHQDNELRLISSQRSRSTSSPLPSPTVTLRASHTLSSSRTTSTGTTSTDTSLSSSGGSSPQPGLALNHQRQRRRRRTGVNRTMARGGSLSEVAEDAGPTASMFRLTASPRNSAAEEGGGAASDSSSGAVAVASETDKVRYVTSMSPAVPLSPPPPPLGIAPLPPILLEVPGGRVGVRRRRSTAVGVIQRSKAVRLRVCTQMQQISSTHKYCRTILYRCCLWA